eukprot:749433-Hanusia_phi.AAC.1
MVEKGVGELLRSSGVGSDDKVVTTASPDSTQVRRYPDKDPPLRALRVVCPPYQGPINSSIFTPPHRTNTPHDISGCAPQLSTLAPP